MKKIFIIITTFLMLMMLAVPAFASETNTLTITSDPSLGSYVIGAIEDANGKKYNFTLDETNDFTQELNVPVGEYSVSYANVLTGEGSIIHCEVLESLYYVPKTVSCSASTSEQLYVEFDLQKQTNEAFTNRNQASDAPTNEEIPPVVEVADPLDNVVGAVVKLMPVLFFVVLGTLAGVAMFIVSYIKNKREENER